MRDEEADGRPPHPSSPIPHPSVLDLLAHLVHKSLVMAEAQGEVVRYRMLETVRQYAAEQLAGVGDVQLLRERHALWCLQLAELAAPHRTDPEQNQWLERLTVEHDNPRAALEWCLADERGVTVGLRLSAVLSWFWWVRGYLGEGRRWITALLAHGDHAPPDVLATALQGAGLLAREQGDYDEAIRLLERGLALRRELGGLAGIAGSLNNLGATAGARGDHARAQALFDESLPLLRELGDRREIASCLGNLGVAVRLQGRPDRAAAILEEALALMRGLGDTHSVATFLLNLGNAHRDQGATEQAAARYRESLPLYRDLGNRLAAARCLGGMAAVAATRGEAGRAARLCGAAAALRAAMGAPLPSAGNSGFERAIAVARAVLDEAEFTAAWAAGQALSFEEAVADALSYQPHA
ncbi:MAG: tetratricopeptide repeat protein [Chloroflexi bacterium]|nr:tetratricopeptide repeat protein [Chloroflexota bacterium]